MNIENLQLEKFDGYGRKKFGVYITITLSRQFCLSKDFCTMYGVQEGDGLVLFYDAFKEVIALQISKLEGFKISKNRSGGGAVNPQSFFRENRLNTKISGRYRIKEYEHPDHGLIFILSKK